MNSCSISNHDLVFDDTPSLKASFGLHKISFGRRSIPSNAERSRYFSTPFCGCFILSESDR